MCQTACVLFRDNPESRCLTEPPTQATWTSASHSPFQFTHAKPSCSHSRCQCLVFAGYTDTPRDFSGMQLHPFWFCAADVFAAVVIIAFICLLLWNNGNSSRNFGGSWKLCDYLPVLNTVLFLTLAGIKCWEHNWLNRNEHFCSFLEVFRKKEKCSICLYYICACSAFIFL